MDLEKQDRGKNSGDVHSPLSTWLLWSDFLQKEIWDINIPLIDAF